MQSVIKVDMSLEEMNVMVKRTLQEKGLVGNVSGLDLNVMSVHRETGVKFSIEVSVKTPERPVVSEGPISR